MYLITIFFFENRAFYEITWKNIVELKKPRTTIQYGACTLYARYLRLQGDIQNTLYLLQQ